MLKCMVISWSWSPTLMVPMNLLIGCEGVCSAVQEMVRVLFLVREEWMVGARGGAVCMC